MAQLPATMKAVFIEEPGGTDKLIYGDLPTPIANPDQVLIKVHRSSVNYIDTYHRTGLYKLPLPAILGRDGAGVVVAIGENVKDIDVGKRVAFVFPQGGAYAEYCAVPSSKVVLLPDDMSFSNAVALMLQGLTAHYLVADTYPFKSGDSLLIHAGAGGTGTVAIQIAKAKGLNVITTVSNEEKRKIVTDLGADHVIISSTEDVYARVMEITNKKGVDYVLDGVGAATYQTSMKCSKKRGFVILFGNASGAVPPLDPLLFTQNGSIFVTRPILADYVLTRDELQGRFDDLLQMIRNKKLSVVVGSEYSLENIKAAHEQICDRTHVGKIVLKICEE